MDDELLHLLLARLFLGYLVCQLLLCYQVRAHRFVKGGLWLLDAVVQFLTVIVFRDESPQIRPILLDWLPRKLGALDYALGLDVDIKARPFL